MTMELALIVLLRPVLYLALFAGVIYWVMRLVWRVLPSGKTKELLFDKTLPLRRPWLTTFVTWGTFIALLLFIALISANS